MAFAAKHPGRCSKTECIHGGRIEVGQKIMYLNLNEGCLRYYHSPECVPARGTVNVGATNVDVSEQISRAVAEAERRLEDKIQDAQPEPRTVRVERWEGKSVTFQSAHQKLQTLLYYGNRRAHTYLWGPPGSGKSTAAHQMAEALGLDYAYVSLNPQSPASLLTGFIDANGRYSETPFYRCYKSGGVFCIDELDNASPQLLTTLNGALANGRAAFPCGMVERHPDFVMVATGNTPGRGGDWHHPERRAIDSATLDRLAYIHWTYDEKLETELVMSQNPKAGGWLTWIRKVRAFAADQANGVRGVYATPRAAIQGAIDLASSGLPIADLAESHVFKGVGADLTQRVLRACPLSA